MERPARCFGMTLEVFAQPALGHVKLLVMVSHSHLKKAPCLEHRDPVGCVSSDFDCLYFFDAFIEGSPIIVLKRSFFLHTFRE